MRSGDGRGTLKSITLFEVLPLNRSDWLLLLLGLSESDGQAAPPMDRVRVMKCLFVLSKNMPTVTGAGFYSFEPYNYGPFDKHVYSDAEALAGEGLLEMVQGRYTKYAVTEAGRAKAAALVPQASGDAVQYLRRVRAWANAVDFSTLVKAIYQAWPEQKANSIFQG